MPPHIDTHNAQHTAPRHDAQFGPRPYVERGEAHQTVAGMGAEFSDRTERRAGYKLKSAYAHLLAIPPIVAAGDVATASAIVYRIDACMERGGWTKNEWARLHKLRDSWSARAHRQDVAFNLRGWRKQGDGKNLSQFERFARAVKKELVSKCGHTSSQRGF